MYKSIVLFAFAAIVNLAAATPPACMLAAINTQDNIADFNSICGDNASDVQSSIQEVCGDSADTALKAFADACKEKGHQVSNPTPSSNPSSTPTGSAATQTTEVSPQNPLGASPTSGTVTDSAGNPVQTGAAGHITVGAGIAGAVVAVVFAAL